MSYPDQDINLATDARCNMAAPLLDFEVRGSSDLERLRELWLAMPSVPWIMATREEGEDNSWPGLDVRTLLRGEESSGRWAVHSIILGPGAEFPAHTYDGVAYWFVNEGQVSVTIGEQIDLLTQSTMAFAPHLTTQAIVNRSAEPVHVTLAHSPAGSDRAFASAHALAKSRPNSTTADYLAALSRCGFSFTQGVAQKNDTRTNAPSPRVHHEVETFADFLALRKKWAQLSPVPKLVRSSKDYYEIAVPTQETRVTVSPEESAGHGSAFLAVMKPGPGAPPHHQPTEEELFIVQGGRFSLTVGTRSAILTPGGLGFAPRYCTHTFSNEGPADVLLATINSPAGHDRGFELMPTGMPMDRLIRRMEDFGFQFHL